MKKLIQTIAGLIAGLIIVLIVNTLVQAFAANILLSQPYKLSFEGIKLIAEFYYSASSFWSSFFVILAPLLSSIIFAEAGMLVLISKNADSYKVSTVIFILINTGYLIVNLITGILAVLAEGSAQHDFINLLKNSDYTHNQQLIFMLMFAVLLLAYINIVLKRMRKYLPTIVESKKRKT